MALLPLAQRLQAALGTQTPLAAVKIVVGKALGDVHDRDLLRAVELCDFNGLTTHAAAASLSLSPRQFFRYRAEAVAAIVYGIENALETREPGMPSAMALLAEAVRLTDPKLSSRLGDADAAADIERRYRFLRADACQRASPPPAASGAWPDVGLHLLCRAEWFALWGRYSEASHVHIALHDRLVDEAGNPSSSFIGTQLLRLEFEGAQRTGNAKRRAAIVRELSGAALEAGTMTSALLTQADALASEGDTLRCRTIVAQVQCAMVSDLETLARVALIYAKCAYLRERDQEALDLATATLRIAPLDAMLAGAAHALIGMATLHLHTAWTLPEGRFGYHNATLEAVAARHLLAAKRYDAATAAARSSIDSARRHEARSILAYALATLSDADELAGNPMRAAETRLLAFETFASCHDAIIARDIFLWPELPQRDLGAMRVDPRFAELLWSFKEQLFPEYRKPAYQRLRPLHIANLQRRCLLASHAANGEDARGTEVQLHADALALLAAMRHAGLGPDAVLGLARTTLHSHWFPSAAFLPLHEREPYRRSFMLLAESFYTSIERHYRFDTSACSQCAQGRESADALAKNVVPAC